jgi:glucuronoarabinoxylan endo-1,4-beta-xylanase
MNHSMQNYQPKGWPRTVAKVAIAVLASVAVAAMVGRPSEAQTVDFSTSLNRVDGFGFSDAFGQANTLKGLPAAQQTQVLDLLYNRQTGAGFNILRVGINTDTNIEPVSPGSPTATPNYVFDGSDGGQVWLAQQGQRYGLTNFYADSWSAPAFMKTNNSVSTGGSLCGVVGTTCASGDWRQAYANYLVQYVKFYKQVGVPINNLGFVNEPDLSTSYASMLFSTDQAIDFLKVFGPTVRSSGLNLTTLCCDGSKWTVGTTFTAAISADPVADSYVDIYSSHQYGAHATTPLPTNKRTWMTEWSSSNGTFNAMWDCNNCSGGPDGMYLANDIIQAFNSGNVNGYLYWWGSANGAAALISTTRGAYTVAGRYYAIAAHSRFIRPGGYRVASTNSNPNINVAAFRNTDGSKVISIINTASTAIQTGFAVDAATANSSVKTYLTDTTHSIAETDTAMLSGVNLSVNLPARSLTTITLPPPAIQGTVQLATTSSLQKLGDGSFQATITVTNGGTGTVQGVQLTSATLGAAAGNPLPQSMLPVSLGSVGPGGSTTTTMNFATSAGASGDSVMERFVGTYAGGTFNGNIRAVLP